MTERQCHDCVWMYSGKIDRKPGQISQEIWCGADRCEFLVYSQSAMCCPLFTQIEEIVIPESSLQPGVFNEHANRPWRRQQGDMDDIFTEEFVDWMYDNSSGATYRLEEHYYEDKRDAALILVFNKENDYLFFKMRWL